MGVGKLPVKNNGGCFLLESKHLCYQLPLITEGVHLQCLCVLKWTGGGLQMPHFTGASHCHSGYVQRASVPKTQQGRLSIQILPHKGWWGS